ncbi:MAG: T9SS type A sorting domain-containing protein [Ginsengibacter sp.]
MKPNLLLTGCVLIFALSLQAQVTRINNNKDLNVVFPFSATKAIVVSAIDSSIWTTDGSLAGTVQLATAVKYEAFGQMLAGKFIFRGSTPATGSEVYAYDGTTVSLVSDINPGIPGSAPSQMALLNGFLYFTAARPGEGRELWRTNGTGGGTTLFKDITVGPVGSFDPSAFGYTEIFSNGTYLLFAANTPASGNELWKSDGTPGGTVILKEINTGNSNADSANPRLFYPYNNLALFVATNGVNGEEIWRSDGTPAGTFMLGDINPGPDSSTYGKISLGPFSIPFPLFFSFHIFNNRAYFNATDGTSTGEIWVTDGTIANTKLVKDVIPGTGSPLVLILDAVNLPNKFIFPVTDDFVAGTRSELWESDGLPGGSTALFKSFTPFVEGDFPVICVPYNADLSSNTYNQTLFQGNNFFFTARTPTSGRELWISDGTTGTGTHVVADINPGGGDGVDTTGIGTYLYTTNTFFFAGNNGTTGTELWKTDGTLANTTIVQDINLNAPDADPSSLLIFNHKILFTATDGDDANHRDLFAVDGSFTPLPVKLTDFTVSPKNYDALLQWTTAQEINVKNFTIQRSYDAQHFEDLGIVQASGTSSSRHSYSFTDPGIMNSGKSIVYYRVTTGDKDGKAENSNVISLKLRGNKEWSVRLLSNPVIDNIRLILSGTNGQVQLSVLDINGKRMYSITLENVNGQITLPAVLQKGIYILETKNNNERKTLKFIK